MRKLKMIFLSFSFLLFAGQFDTFGLPTFLPDAVDCPPPTESTLAFQAKIYFGAEDEESEPVEADFYLLDESLIKTLKAAHFKPVYPDGKKHKITDEDYLEAAAKVLFLRGDQEDQEDREEAEMLNLLINEALSAHQLAGVRTNSFGRGYLRGVKTGNYFLLGIGRTEDEVIVWHLPVEIRAAKNSVELDQNNAAVIFPINE